MTCKRCEDIHTAQKNGKTQEQCKCDCHNTYIGTTTATTGTITNKDFSNWWSDGYDLSGSATVNLTHLSNTPTATFKCSCPYCQGNHD